jgi:hypothetical protein
VLIQELEATRAALLLTRLDDNHRERLLAAMHIGRSSPTALGPRSFQVEYGSNEAGVSRRRGTTLRRARSYRRTPSAAR